MRVRWLLAAGLAAAVLLGGGTARATLRVALLGLDPKGPVGARLTLDPDVVVVPDPAQADVIVARAGHAAFAAALQAAARGRGALVILAPDAPADLAPLGARVLGPAPAGAALPPAPVDWLGRQVAWNSAPEIQALVRLAPGALRPRVATRTGTPAILGAPLGAGRVVVVAADIDGPVNASLHRWGYFPYLLRGLLADAAGQPAPAFATWGPAPVPHRQAFLIWIVLGLALWALALFGYRVARRRGRADPDAALRFMTAVAATGGGADAAARERNRAWTKIGFARPLSAFLLLMSIMVVALAPYVVLLTVVMGNWVQPFPEAEGLWRPLYEAAFFFWALFDMGTQTAFVKYFAEFRAKDAREAVRCVQFYFWWQVFSRLAQLTVVCAIAAYLPRTQYALFAHFLALYGLVQLPGLFVGVKFVIQAVQRFDLQLTLDLVEQRLAMYLVPIPFVFLFRAWGRAHPEYGEAFGAALGLAMGPQLAAILVAAVGFYFVKVRLKLPLGPLLLAQFTRQTAKRLLTFGYKSALGQEPFRIANIVENGIIVTRLAAYQTWLGLRSVLTNLTQYVALFAWSYFASAVPALSEAHGAGKTKLCQYYLVRYLQFAHVFVAVLVALMGAVGAPLIRDVMAPQWARAGDYMLLAAAVLLFLPLAWMSDMLQQGSGRTGLNVIVVLIEQVVRVGLFYLLIPTLQFPGMYLAIIGTLALKCVVGWLCNHLLIVRLRIYLWQMFAAPALMGLLIYGLWRGILAVGVWHGFWPVLILFCVATPVSLGLGFFLTGLVGGFDAAALGELDEAAAMGAGLRRLARLFAGLARAGYRLSPLRERFPVTLAAAAAAEARELEAAEVAIVDQTP
ncbi:MAG TPA: hypothetical protein VGQ83_18625 [Polyangia bacterium]